MAKVCPNCELTYSDAEFFCAADGSPLRSTNPEAENLVGTVIAERYRIDAILGEGGMGRVYRARHVRVPREAAIKVLRRALITDPYAIAAFNREARNAASVGDHPNIAAVYDFGETGDGLVFLAMEFVEGETLGRQLEREPVLPPVRAVEIIRQIASGLTAAHELPEPVVHRDLKPDNILLKATRDGSDWVKIVDFGIAKAAKRDTQLLTSPGLVVGTPRYMSPEQLTGGAIDVRSDIYALAMIAFQMLTGQMPFASASREDESTIPWALQRLTVSPFTLAQVRPDIDWPAAAHDAFARALAADADARTPSANEFAAALARAFGFATPTRSIGTVPGVPAPISSAVSAATRSAAPTAPPSAAAGDDGSNSRTGAGPIHTRPAGGPTPLVAASSAGTRPPRRMMAVAIGVAAIVVAGAGGLTWRQRRDGGDAVVSMSPSVVAPNDSASLGKVDPAVSSAAVEDSSGTGSSAARDSTPPPVIDGTAQRADRSTPSSSLNPRTDVRPSDAGASARARQALTVVKTALADPDEVATAGNGTALLREVARLMPLLSSRADSVEATYYAIETNLILERPDDACRLLVKIRDTSVGTAFAVPVERFLADPDLACASRR